MYVSDRFLFRQIRHQFFFSGESSYEVNGIHDPLEFKYTSSHCAAWLFEPKQFENVAGPFENIAPPLN